MKSNIHICAVLAALLCCLVSCEGLGEHEPPEFDVNALAAGLTAVPDSLNADSPATFYFKADSSSPLYDSEEDLYFYTGVWYDSSDWRYVQADWGVNTDK